MLGLVWLTVPVAFAHQNSFAARSDLYYANASLNKPEWQYIVGGVAFLAVFVPDYGHFRSGAVNGILMTTVTSFYMFVAALSVGQV